MSITQSVLFATRSAVFKMLSGVSDDDRKVNSFPPPFHSEFTPYDRRDFSDYVRNTCLKSKPVISSLRICKVIILGDVAVGKTSLVNRFCHHTFDSNYKATIGVDFEVERFNILNVPFNIQIWDTAGQERFKCIAQAYYRSAHIVVLVFDLCNLRTLSNCKTWLEDALKTLSHQPYIFLVGTKKDLLAQVVYNGIERYISKISKDLNAEYWAVSAQSGECVQTLFKRIAAMGFNQIIESEKHNTRAISIGSNLSSLSNYPKEVERRRPCSGCN